MTFLGGILTGSVVGLAVENEGISKIVKAPKTSALFGGLPPTHTGGLSRAVGCGRMHMCGRNPKSPGPRRDKPKKL